MSTPSQILKFVNRQKKSDSYKNNNQTKLLIDSMETSVKETNAIVFMTQDTCKIVQKEKYLCKDCTIVEQETIVEEECFEFSNFKISKITPAKHPCFKYKYTIKLFLNSSGYVILKFYSNNEFVKMEDIPVQIISITKSL